MNKIILFFLVIILYSSGCRREEKPDDSTHEGINISDSWIRAGVKDRNTAAFMKITNNSDLEDTLFSASSDLAKVVEIHETFSGENDLKGMRHVDYIVVPSNSMTELKPNGLHVMLIGLAKNLKSGDGGKITLSFRTAGDKSIQVTVK